MCMCVCGGGGGGAWGEILNTGPCQLLPALSMAPTLQDKDNEQLKYILS